MPLVNGRYIARSAGEWFASLRDLLDIEASSLGMEPPTWSHKEAVAVLYRLVAQMLGEIDQIPSGIEEVLDPNQMSGAVLRRFAGYAGISVNPAERSTVLLTVGASATAAVVLTAGTQASDGVYTWETLDDVTIPQGGTTTVSAQALVDGAILLASGSIQQRRTSVPGWISVTNESSTVPGFDGDSDATVRQKISSGQGGFGSQSPAAIQYALEQVTSVRNARVVFNPTHADATISGRVIPPTGAGVWIYPNTIPDESRLACASILYAMLAGDTNRSLPTTTGATGVRATIPLPYGGQLTTEGFWWMTETQIFAHITLVLVRSGYTEATLLPQIRATALAFFADLAPGDQLEQQELLAACTTIPGVARVTVLIGLSSGTVADQDIPIDAASFARLDTDDLTVVGSGL